MRYRHALMIVLPALAVVMAPSPRPAAEPAPQPSAEQIDSALRSARLDAGLPAMQQARR